MYCSYKTILTIFFLSCRNNLLPCRTKPISDKNNLFILLGTLPSVYLQMFFVPFDIAKVCMFAHTTKHFETFLLAFVIFLI